MKYIINFLCKFVWKRKGEVFVGFFIRYSFFCPIDLRKPTLCLVLGKYEIYSKSLQPRYFVA